MAEQNENPQPQALSSAQMGEPETGDPSLMPAETPKSRLRAFWDFFVLFSGISTRSNLSRTRKDPIQSRGLFLFRRSPKK
jgi:hypothetical protein